MTRWLVGENTDMLQCKQKTDIDDHDLSNLTCPSVGMQQGPSIGSSKGAELDPSEVFLSVCFGAFAFFLVSFWCFPLRSLYSYLLVLRFMLVLPFTQRSNGTN